MGYGHRIAHATSGVSTPGLRRAHQGARLADVVGVLAFEEVAQGFALLGRATVPNVDAHVGHPPRPALAALHIHDGLPCRGTRTGTDQRTGQRPRQSVVVIPRHGAGCATEKATGEGGQHLRVGKATPRSATELGGRRLTSFFFGGPSRFPSAGIHLVFDEPLAPISHDAQGLATQANHFATLRVFHNDWLGATNLAVGLLHEVTLELDVVAHGLHHLVLRRAGQSVNGHALARTARDGSARHFIHDVPCAVPNVAHDAHRLVANGHVPFATSELGQHRPVRTASPLALGRTQALKLALGQLAGGVRGDQRNVRHWRPNGAVCHRGALAGQGQGIDAVAELVDLTRRALYRTASDVEQRMRPAALDDVRGMAQPEGAQGTHRLLEQGMVPTILLRHDGQR